MVLKIKVLGPHRTQARDSVKPLDCNWNLLEQEESFLKIFRCSCQSSAEFQDEGQAFVVHRPHRFYCDRGKTVSRLKLSVFGLLSGRGYFSRSSCRCWCLGQVRWRESVNDCHIPNQRTPAFPRNQGLAIRSFPIQSGKANRFPDRWYACPDETAQHNIVNWRMSCLSAEAQWASHSMRASGWDHCSTCACVWGTDDRP